MTPFVLAYLHERSGGKTVEANKKLVVANAGLAAEVAVALRRCVTGAQPLSRSISSSTSIAS